MAAALVSPGIPGVTAQGLERLARALMVLRAGKPLAHGGALHRPRAVADGLELEELRPFVPGDDPRRIDWRASARSRADLIRRYRDERAGEWLVCLDRSASMGAATGVWPRALQLAAGALFLILHCEHRVGLVLFGDRLDRVLPPGRGRRAFPALVAPLASALPSPGGGDSRPECCAPLLERGRRAILISDCLRPDAMTGALDRLAAGSGGLELLHLAAPPPALPPGPCTIADAESGATRAIDATAQAQGAAALRYAELQSRLIVHCRKRHIRYTRSEWDAGADDWECVLLRHFAGPVNGRT